MRLSRLHPLRGTLSSVASAAYHHFEETVATSSNEREQKCWRVVTFWAARSRLHWAPDVPAPRVLSPLVVSFALLGGFSRQKKAIRSGSLHVGGLRVTLKATQSKCQHSFDPRREACSAACSQVQTSSPSSPLAGDRLMTTS